jgi:hypothetical protein
VLRGISFHGAGVGQSAINATQIGSLYVEHCSISEFNAAGVRMFNGGNLWITDTSVRACFDGIDAGVNGATPAHLVAEDSLISGSRNVGVFVVSNGTAPATGLLVNCTAALGNGPGFSAAADQSADVEMALVNCRAFGNSFGVAAEARSTGNATIRIGGCVLTGNVTGIAVVAHSTGVPSVLGTSPGTNFITGNTTDGTTTGNVTLANWIHGPLDNDRLPSESDPFPPAGTRAGDQRLPSESGPPLTAAAQKHPQGRISHLHSVATDQRPSEAVAYFSSNRRTTLTKERL